MMRQIYTITLFISVWWIGVQLFSPPTFILPAPESVAIALWENADNLAYHSFITFSEIIVGLIIGTILGVTTALLMNTTNFMEQTIRPMIIASQALPVFAIAPLLILWFGLGLGSKIAMATLIIYFPVASALCDGLARTNGGLIDLAKLHNANRWQILMYFRLPNALPSLASGLRVAVNVAPIGAIVGEWVGAAAGLGFIINQANARLQVSLVFASLVILIIMVVALRWITDYMLDKVLHWTPKT